MADWRIERALIKIYDKNDIIIDRIHYSLSRFIPPFFQVPLGDGRAQRRLARGGARPCRTPLQLGPTRLRHWT